jgi:hypothetical protein
MNIQQLLESANPYKDVQSQSAKLVSKWTKSGLLKNITNENEINNTSVILENQAKQLVLEGNVGGGTNSMSGGAYNSENWAGVALPLVRRIFDEISAKEFLSTQPMNLPSGLVFYLDFKYGNSRTPFNAGDSIYGADPNTNVTNITGGLYGEGRFAYSINNATASATYISSSVAAADVNFDSNYATASLTKLTVPTSSATNYDTNGVRAFIFSSGSVSANNILQQFTKQDGVGNFIFITNGVGIAGTGTGTLTYQKQTNPAQRGDFEDAVDNGVNDATSSQLSQSQPISIPEINVQMKSEAIVAKTRKLKAQWSPEFAQDLNAYHNIDAEAELTGVLSQYISMEIDLELLDMLVQNAYTVDYWSAKNNTFYNGSGFTTSTDVTNGGYYNSQGQWFQTLGTKLQKVSNKVHQLTLRGGCNFMVISPAIATIIESIPGFASDGDGEKSDFNFGIQKMGSLNSRYKVWKNPYLTENVIFMGYRGAQFLECGAVFAPYIPLIMTPLIYDPNSFTPRKGLMTRYAKMMIRPDYYAKVYVNGLETV